MLLMLLAADGAMTAGNSEGARVHRRAPPVGAHGQVQGGGGGDRAGEEGASSLVLLLFTRITWYYDLSRGGVIYSTINYYNTSI